MKVSTAILESPRVAGPRCRFPGDPAGGMGTWSSPTRGDLALSPPPGMRASPTVEFTAQASGSWGHNPQGMPAPGHKLLPLSQRLSYSDSPAPAKLLEEL